MAQSEGQTRVGTASKGRTWLVLLLVVFIALVATTYAQWAPGGGNLSGDDPTVLYFWAKW